MSKVLSTRWAPAALAPKKRAPMAPTINCPVIPVVKREKLRRLGPLELCGALVRRPDVYDSALNTKVVRGGRCERIGDPARAVDDERILVPSGRQRNRRGPDSGSCRPLQPGDSLGPGVEGADELHGAGTRVYKHKPYHVDRVAAGRPRRRRCGNRGFGCVRVIGQS